MAKLAIYITNNLKIIQFLRNYVYLYNINKILLLVICANPFSVICSPANQRKLTQESEILSPYILSCMTSFSEYKTFSLKFSS